MSKCQFSISDIDRLNENLFDEEFELLKRNIITRTDCYYDGIYHCSICGDHKVSGKDLREMRASHICKFCGNEVYKIARKPTSYIKFLVELPRENYNALYLCELDEKKNLYTSWCGVEYGKDLYVRGIGCYMGYHLYKTDSTTWRKTQSQGIRYQTCSLFGLDRMKYSSLKEYYESYQGTLKSNQKYFIMNGVFNHEQMDAIILFDLKSGEEVYKHRKYIEKNYCKRYLNKKLNIYALEYLEKNDIKVGDYIDHLEMCEQLGIKMKYPKNFYREHERISKIKKAEDYKKFQLQIGEVYQRLLINKFEDDEFVLEPFASSEELVYEGETQHICIATYCKKYALGESELYKLRKKDNPSEPYVAIEVKKGELIQERTKFNAMPDKKAKEFIDKWIKEYKYETIIQSC